MASLRFLVAVAATLLALSRGVLMPEELDKERGKDFGAAFQQCLLGGGPVAPCVGEGVLSALRDADAKDEVRPMEGVVMRGTGADRAPRLGPLDTASGGDLQSVLDAASGFLGRRTVSWDMDAIFPGLSLRLSPGAAPLDSYGVGGGGGAGFLEFVMEKRYSPLDERHLGTGRLILRQTLLPVLLALKLPVVALVPLVLGALALLAKKAMLVGKVALLVAGLLGAGTLLQSPFLRPPLHTSHHIDPLSLYTPYFRGLKNSPDLGRTDSTTSSSRNFVWE